MQKRSRRLYHERLNSRLLLAVDLGFEDVGGPLASDSHWNGPDPNGVNQLGPFGDTVRVGGFESGGLAFNNNYSLDFGSWVGWAYSNETDNTTAGFQNQHAAFAGSGAGGSSSYAVAFAGSADNLPTIALTDETADQPLNSILVTNTTYAALNMQQGDQFSRRFGWLDANFDGDFDDAGDFEGNYPDWLLLTVEGKDSGGQSVGTVDFYLADFRSVDDNLDYIVDAWTAVDVSSLNAAETYEFSLTSSDIGPFGMNTPAYFALDRVDIGLEDVGVSLAPESSFVGPDPNGTQDVGEFGDTIVVGEFESGSLAFNNVYSLDFGTWSGWAYSNETDTTTSGFTNQLSAFPGSGAFNSDDFVVAFMDPANPPTIDLTNEVAGQSFRSIMITNTTYPALSMLNGDQFARRFGWFDANFDGDFDDTGDSAGDHPDWLRVDVVGLDSQGQSIGTVEVYLADYRFDNSGDDYVLDEWIEVDLAPLAGATQLSFALASSDVGDFGVNTPAYFAVDNIHLAKVANPVVLDVVLNAAQVDPADLNDKPQPSSWQQQRSLLQSIDIQFDQPMDWNALDLSNINLVNLGIDAGVDADVPVALEMRHLNPLNSTTLRVEFTVPDANNASELADGVYELVVTGLAAENGLDMAEDFVLTGSQANSLYQFNVDWNGDTGVSVFDFSVISYWFGRSIGEAPDYADLNLDGGVSVFDFGRFADNFGVGVTFENANFARSAAVEQRQTSVQRLERDKPTARHKADVALQELLLEWTWLN
ncbi:MAG: hypothetical protein ACI9G1_001181 [Pirellulaceae bacterium]|jgi:hypothetical protein